MALTVLAEHVVDPIFLAIAVALLAAFVLYIIRRGHAADELDLGVLSPRWLSEHRDEPSTR